MGQGGMSLEVKATGELHFAVAVCWTTNDVARNAEIIVVRLRIGHSEVVPVQGIQQLGLQLEGEPFCDARVLDDADVLIEEVEVADFTGHTRYVAQAEGTAVPVGCVVLVIECGMRLQSS